MDGAGLAILRPPQDHGAPLQGNIAAPIHPQGLGDASAGVGQEYDSSGAPLGVQ